MRPIKYLAFNGKELVPVISLDSMKDGEPVVLVSEDGSGDLPLKNLGKVPVYEFTGNKAKRKDEIYAGHVLKIQLPLGGFWGNVGREEIGVVRYEADFGGYIVEWEGGKNQHHIILDCDIAFESEILGHIQTNPELVK